MHIRPMSRVPEAGQIQGDLNFLEIVILGLFNLFFSNNPNFDTVVGALEKYYRKTPS